MEPVRVPGFVAGARSAVVLRSRAASAGARLAAALTVLAGLAACVTPPSDDELKARYVAAVADAKDAEPAEVATGLVWIGPANPDLVWSPARDRVLVVTWTNWSGYDGLVGRETTVGRETWVTAVPELRRRCAAIPPGTDVTLRLEQLLGLPPRNGKTKLVQLWVSPGDLFRPAADPEIGDREAGPDFPNNRRVAVTAAHRAWIEDLESKSYGADGYPWTRLGYTYDWNNPRSEVGLSEFVVEKGAVVRVESVQDTASYCRP